MLKDYGNKVVEKRSTEEINGLVHFERCSNYAKVFYYIINIDKQLKWLPSKKENEGFYNFHCTKKPANENDLTVL